MTLAIPTAVQDKALKLLGAGLPQNVVASAIGVSESQISQLMADPDFSHRVGEVRFGEAVRFTERDKAYDALEDSLLERLKDTAAFLMDPMKVTRVLEVVNRAKRTGAGALGLGEAKAEVAQLQMPTILARQFVLNINAQVIQAGEQTLVTIPSGAVAKMANEVLSLGNSSPPQNQGVQNVGPVPAIEIAKERSGGLGAR